MIGPKFIEQTTAVRFYLAAELCSIAEALEAEVTAGRCPAKIAENARAEADRATWWALFDSDRPLLADHRQREQAVRHWCTEHLAEIEQVRRWADGGLRLGPGT